MVYNISSHDLAIDDIHQTNLTYTHLEHQL